MFAETHLTLTELSPLFQGPHADHRDVNRALVRIHPRIQRVAAKAARRERGARRLPSDDLAQELVAKLLARVRQRGLPTPRGPLDRHSLDRWLWRTLRNLASDVLDHERRQALAHAEGLYTGGDDPTPNDGEYLPGARVCTAPWLVIDERQAFEATVAAANSSEMPALWALAWLAVNDPQAVEPAHIARASGVPRRGRSAASVGLARPALETWARFLTWRARWGALSHREDAHEELVWVLRSTDRFGYPVWSASCPDDAVRAMVTFRKWVARAEVRLELRAAA